MFHHFGSLVWRAAHYFLGDGGWQVGEAGLGLLLVVVIVGGAGSGGGGGGIAVVAFVFAR